MHAQVREHLLSVLASLCIKCGTNVTASLRSFGDTNINAMPGMLKKLDSYYSLTILMSILLLVIPLLIPYCNFYSYC